MSAATSLSELPKRSPDLNILKNSFLNLVHFAQSSLPERSRQELFQACIEVLEQALSGTREATEMVNRISTQARVSLVKNKKQQSAEDSLEHQLNKLPAKGDLTLNLSTVERISIALVARCLVVKQELLRRGDKLILKNVGNHIQETLENMQLDRMFEIHYRT